MFMNIMDGTVRQRRAAARCRRYFGVPIGPVSGVVTAYLATLLWRCRVRRMRSTASAAATPARGDHGVHRGVGACGLATSLPELVAFRALQGARRRDRCVPVGHDDDHPGVPARRADHGQPGADRADAARPRARPGDRRRAGDGLSWRWIFYINLPVGVAAHRSVGSAVPPRRVRPPGPVPFDRPGFLLAAAGLPAGHVRAVDRLVHSGWGSAAVLAHRAARPGAARRSSSGSWNCDIAPSRCCDCGSYRRPAVPDHQPAAHRRRRRASWARCSSSRCCCERPRLLRDPLGPVHLHRGARRHDRRAADLPPVQAGRDRAA